jgi:hypothetical protein
VSGLDTTGRFIANKEAVLARGLVERIIDFRSFPGHKGRRASAPSDSRTLEGMSYFSPHESRKVTERPKKEVAMTTSPALDGDPYCLVTGDEVRKHINAIGKSENRI